MFKRQFEAYNFQTQFGAICAGVQSGKTFTGVYWAGKKMDTFPTGTGIIVAPTYKILQHATMRKVFESFPALRQYYKEQKGEIALPSGGVVYVRSADNPLGVEGITADWWWGDELGMCSILIWTVLRSRVSQTGGQGLITTTPYNLQWLYTDYYIPWKEGIDPDFSFFTWRSIDNPFFSKAYYEAERRRLKPEEFARRYMGEFKKMTGLVYDLPEEAIIPLVDIRNKCEARIIGVDWGYTNPAAVVVLYLYDGEWYVVDEWKRSKRTTGEIIQVIQNKITEHHVTKVYPDPAEPDRFEECSRADIPVMEVQKDIKGGISQIQQAIREKRFHVFEDCKETIDEMSMYHYPEAEEGKDTKDLPEPFNNHLCDAIRYAITSFEPPTRKGPPVATAPIPRFYPELGF
jgi:phage terminase large subunit